MQPKYKVTQTEANLEYGAEVTMDESWQETTIKQKISTEDAIGIDNAELEEEVKQEMQSEDDVSIVKVVFYQKMKLRLLQTNNCGT